VVDDDDLRRGSSWDPTGSAESAGGAARDPVTSATLLLIHPAPAAKAACNRGFLVRVRLPSF